MALSSNVAADTSSATDRLQVSLTFGGEWRDERLLEFVFFFLLTIPSQHYYILCKLVEESSSKTKQLTVSE